MCASSFKKNGSRAIIALSVPPSISCDSSTSQPTQASLCQPPTTTFSSNDDTARLYLFSFWFLLLISFLQDQFPQPHAHLSSSPQLCFLYLPLHHYSVLSHLSHALHFLFSSRRKTSMWRWNGSSPAGVSPVPASFQIIGCSSSDNLDFILLLRLWMSLSFS